MNNSIQTSPKNSKTNHNLLTVARQLGKKQGSADCHACSIVNDFERVIGPLFDNPPSSL